MQVKILGTGCPNCQRLERMAREASQEVGVQVDFVKVTDIQQIMAYPILGTPGLVINEVVKSSGRIPRKEEIIAWLREAQ